MLGVSFTLDNVRWYLCKQLKSFIFAILNVSENYDIFKLLILFETYVWDENYFLKSIRILFSIIVKFLNVVYRIGGRVFIIYKK